MSDDFQTRVMEKLDTLTNEVSEVKVSLARWDKHIYRLDEVEKKTAELEAKIVPIADKYGVAKGLAALAFIGAALATFFVHVRDLFAGGK